MDCEKKRERCLKLNRQKKEKEIQAAVIMKKGKKKKQINEIDLNYKVPCDKTFVQGESSKKIP